MSNSTNYIQNQKISKEFNQFLEKSVYVKEDDQDWGSSGMNDIQDSE